jgi:hypothetical protein
MMAREEKKTVEKARYSKYRVENRAAYFLLARLRRRMKLL